MTVSRHWQDLAWTDFRSLPDDTVAILPVAAVEQHGPHLPVSVDATINAGMLARALELVPADATGAGAADAVRRAFGRACTLSRHADAVGGNPDRRADRDRAQRGARRGAAAGDPEQSWRPAAGGRYRLPAAARRGHVRGQLHGEPPGTAAGRMLSREEQRLRHPRRPGGDQPDAASAPRSGADGPGDRFPQRLAGAGGARCRC